MSKKSEEWVAPSLSEEVERLQAANAELSERALEVGKWKERNKTLAEEAEKLTAHNLDLTERVEKLEQEVQERVAQLEEMEKASLSWSAKLEKEKHKVKDWQHHSDTVEESFGREIDRLRKRIEVTQLVVEKLTTENLKLYEQRDVLIAALGKVGQEDE